MIKLTKYEYYINSLMQCGFAIPIVAIFAENGHGLLKFKLLL